MTQTSPTGQFLEFIDTVLYVTAPGEEEYSYVVTFKRGTINEYEPDYIRANQVALEATAKEIFDSFRIMSK